jgi:anthranilate phosphoribosyltransferase
MKIEEIIKKTINKTDLQKDESKCLFSNIMEGKIRDEDLKKILVNLSEKGETVEEITGGAEVLREKSLKVNIEGDVIDTCGTGGDGKNTINISTAVALVLASMGHKVAKHGNKSVSSKSGSADVLEKLGIKINLNAKEVEKSIKENNFAFMFAPNFHSAMKNVANVRKNLKKRTIFNLLGPLCNPANVNRQCIGVFSDNILEKYIKVLKNLNLKKAWVYHSHDGLDEISIFNKTKVYELNDNEIKSFEIDPEKIIDKKYNFNEIVGDDADYNSKQIINLFNGKDGALLEIVSLNAAAGLIVLDKYKKIEDAFIFTKKHIKSKKVFDYLNIIKK